MNDGIRKNGRVEEINVSDPRGFRGRLIMNMFK